MTPLAPLHFTLFLLLLVLAAPVSAADVQWKRNNPGGGGSFLAAGAGPDGLMLIGSDLSGAYRSDNRGQSWTVIGATQGLTSTHVSAVGFHPTDPDVLFLGTEDGIFRSDDKALHFSPVLEAPEGQVAAYTKAITVSPANTDIVFAAVHLRSSWDESSPFSGYVYRSDNGGQLWAKVSRSGLSPEHLSILKLLPDPQDANTVYLLTGADRNEDVQDARVYVSHNGGLDWQRLAATQGQIMDIALKPGSPRTLYISTYNPQDTRAGSLFRSDDNGAQWQKLTDHSGVIFTSPSRPDDITLIDPREPFRWNDATSGTWKSSDGGIHWSQTGKVETWDHFYQGKLQGIFGQDEPPDTRTYGEGHAGLVKALGHDLSNPESILWVNTQWAFHSSDNGAHFSNLFTNKVGDNRWLSRGLDNVNMMDIAVSEANPNLVYLGYFDAGCWRSEDHGASWQSCNTPDFTKTGADSEWFGYGGNVASIVTDPTRENRVWATLSPFQNGESPTHLVRSSQKGLWSSWEASGNGLPDQHILGLSLDRNSPENSRTLFVTALGNVYRSRDDGKNWQPVFDCNGGCSTSAVSRFDGQRVFAGGYAGLYRSTNGGNDWARIGGNVFDGQPGEGFWGYGWQGVFQIESDPKNPLRVYATLFGDGKGLYRSDDGGDHWTKLLSDNFLRGIAISPNNANILYATSSSAFQAGGYDPASQGVLRSLDGGQTWENAMGNMAWPFAVPVVIDNTDTVFVGSPGSGFQTSIIDQDGDKLSDAQDNCPLIQNGDQRDSDNDGNGNQCDPDLNNDQHVDFIDLSLLKTDFPKAPSALVSAGFAELETVNSAFFLDLPLSP